MIELIKNLIRMILMEEKSKKEWRENMDNISKRNNYKK